MAQQTFRHKYVVKPIFMDEAGRHRLYLVYDTTNQRYESTPIGNIMVPNFTLTGDRHVMEDLRSWFESMGCGMSEWKVAPPGYAQPGQLDKYIKMAQPIPN